MKKYELTGETKKFAGLTLHRIKAVRKFGDVKEGDFGGWIEKEDNLSHNNIAWVYGDAWVHGDARVSGDARVYGDAWVHGDALVYGDARVYGNAQVSGNARVSDSARVSGDAWVHGDARVHGDAQVSGNARVSDSARIFGNARVSGDARVFGNARVSSNDDILHITGLGTVHRTTTVFMTDDGVRISCGCFYGTTDEFREQVVKTRGGKVREEYLKFAGLVEIYFGIRKDGGEAG